MGGKMTKRGVNSSINKVNCPHCDSVARFANSHLLNKCYREITFQCQNTLCGFVFVAGLEPLRTLSPSSIPNPEIRIPLSTHIKKNSVMAQLKQDDFVPKPREYQGELDV